MHVVFVLPRFFPYRGGYENSLLALSRYLVAHGHRATVFTTVANDLEALWVPGFKTFPDGGLLVDGVTIRRFPISYDRLRRRAMRVLGLAPYWRWKAQYWRPSFEVPGLAQALAEVDADIFHIGPLPYNNLMYGGLHAGEVRKIPVVATPCPHFGDEEIARQYLGPHQMQLLRSCNKVLCMTETERRRLQQLGVRPERLAVAPHGIELTTVTGGNREFLRKKNGVDGPVVLHLGMKAFDKGSQTLVEAMKILWAKGSKAWLVMAGPSLSTFDTYIAEPGRNCSRLLNLPPYGDDERRDLLASATLVAQPSRVESLGLVLMEAWANRVPVIAADIAVSCELVGASGGGVTVPFGNAEKLADAVEKLLDDPEARNQMGMAGYKMALRYSGDAIWQHIMAEFEQAAGAARTAMVR